MNVFWTTIGVIAFILYYFVSRMQKHRAVFDSDKKKWFQLTAYQFWKDWIEPFLIAGILALVIRTYFFGPYKIPSASMRPTFMEGDRIFVDKFTYRFREPKRGDIIVFKYPQDLKKDFVKRLAGLPGDRLMIRDGKLFVNGEAQDSLPFSKYYYYNRPDWAYGKEDLIIDVPQNSFFVLGDNSAQSSDSRNWGFVPRKNLVGRAFVIWWPPKRIKQAE